MPILEEISEATQIRVSASAPLELMWILHNLQAKHLLSGPYSSLEPLREELQPKLRSFWGDGVRGYTEVIVLSERSGTTLDLDLDRFFDRLGEAVNADGQGLSLLSERPSEGLALAGRLQRLRDDRSLRSRYRTLVMSTWERDRGEGETSGRRAVTEAALDWNRMLAEGAGYRTLLDRPHVGPGRPELDELAEPTVSGHVQTLREAGLLEDKIAGRRSKLIVARERLKGLMGDAEESML